MTEGRADRLPCVASNEHDWQWHSNPQSTPRAYRMCPNCHAVDASEALEAVQQRLREEASCAGRLQDQLRAACTEGADARARVAELEHDNATLRLRLAPVDSPDFAALLVELGVDMTNPTEVLAEKVVQQRERIVELEEERDLAIAHDRQPYPTAWAYEQACEALERHRERADKAEAALEVAWRTLTAIQAADPDLFDPRGGTSRGAAYETYGTPGHKLRGKYLAAIGLEPEEETEDD
jgi:hypothetical protein